MKKPIWQNQTAVFIATMILTFAVINGWGRFAGWLGDQGIPIWAIWIAGLVGWIWLMGASAKWSVMALLGKREIDFVPTTLHQFAGVSTPTAGGSVAPLPDPAALRLPVAVAQIEGFTRDWMALGFQHAADYTFAPNTQEGLKIRVFARLLIHPQQHAYLCIRQTLPSAAKANPIRMALYTLYPDESEVFSVAAPALMDNLIAHLPNSISEFFPKASAATLWQQHLQSRAQHEAATGLRPKSELSLDHYIQYEKQGASRVISGYKRKSAFWIIWMLVMAKRTRRLASRPATPVVQPAS